MSSLGTKLRSLDNRLLGFDKQRAALRTEEGWRRYAGRWRVMIGVAIALGAYQVIGSFFDVFTVAMTPLIGIVAFQAGAMKAEEDRLQRRGRELLRPPGL